MAINRVALWNNAEYGYQPPANATGLNGMYANWMDKSVSNALATYNPTAAKALLKRAGFTLKGGKLYDPKGHRVSFEINVVTGWTDWIAACQIIAQNLQALGMDVAVKPLQFGAYFSAESNGQFDASMSWSCAGFTPYDLYNGYMGAQNYAPIGKAALGCNFERFTNAQMEQLFVKFRGTLDTGQQHALVNQMQRLFVKYLPVIPTTINALWYEYNPTHYTGFPTQSNYYVAGPVWVQPDRLVVLTRLRPTGH
jgi:peptide/nickel transport system substrate-binding protein